MWTYTFDWKRTKFLYALNLNYNIFTSCVQDMEAKRIVSFAAIAELFANDQQQLKRGENALQSGHIRSMTINSEIEPILLKGEVFASMKKKTYKVEVIYEWNFKPLFILLKLICTRDSMQHV